MDANDVSGKRLAVSAEALYLANLLLLPGLAFLWLAFLAYSNRRNGSALARCHLQQTLVASLWAVALLLPVTLLVLALGNYESIVAWTIAILYFTVCHATLVLFGVVGLARALTGKMWRYPLIGPHCEALS